MKKMHFQVGGEIGCLKRSVRPNNLVWHYTRINLFYDIIKTDGFWATQVRFSNDSDELRFALKTLGDASPENIKAAILDYSKFSYPDTYIVSLCGEYDQLSQWRGYCVTDKGVSEGISIGLDLSAPFDIYLSKKEKEPLPINERLECWSIRYFDKNTSADVLSSEINSDMLLDPSTAAKYAPFIKNRGFKEENEYRLAILNDDGRLTDYVQYRLSDGLQVPYICLKFGNHEVKKEGTIRLILPVSDKYNLLRERIVKKYPDITVLDCCDNKARYTETTGCSGCSRWHTFEKMDVEGFQVCGFADDTTDERYIVKPDYQNAQIIISQGENQYEVWEKIYSIVTQWRTDVANGSRNGTPTVRVFCEGHLPIRKIYVGNTHRVEVLRENVKHFCEHNAEFYWLRDVDVVSSEIPYRTPHSFN